MGRKGYALNDIVVMKKPHPCGTNRWAIIRLGADIRIKCIECNRSIMMPRAKFEQSLKSVIKDETELIQEATNLRQDKNFNWPSTYAEESSESNRNDLDIEMPSQSELYQLGYRITGLNRTERWKILNEKVLPSMSIKKVVNTIAAHIRNRKRQRDGHIKYKYAIQEWEYDLERLRQKFINS